MYSILYVDDEPGLLEIAKIFLEQDKEFSVDTDPSAEHALGSIGTRSYDAIVSDYQMPGMDGIGFLKAVRERYGDIPFILFTGRGREEVVIQAINNGADFYLQKGGDPRAQFAELAHKVRQAVARKRAEYSLVESEKRLTDIINFLPDATFAIDRAGTVIAWNRAIEEMTGVPAREMIGKGDYEYAVPFYATRRKILIDLIFEPDDVIAKNYANIHREKDVLIADTNLPRPLGKVVRLAGKASPLYDRQGRIVGAIESIRDITRQDRDAEQIAQKTSALSIINRIIQVSNLPQTIDEYAKNVLSLTIDLLKYHAGGVYLVDDDHQVAKIVISVNLPPAFIATVDNIDVNNAPYDALFIRGEPVIIENLETVLPQAAAVSGFHAIASIPIVAQDTVIGALNVASTESSLVDREDREILLAIGREFGSAIARIKAESALRESESRLRYMLGLYGRAEKSEHELRMYAVEGAGAVTGSPLGCLAFLSEDESVMTMYAWSESAMKECALREKPIVYPVEKTGLWGEAVRQRRPVITNDYAAPNPQKKGYPEGHPKIVRHMNVPVFDGDRIVLVAGVANRPSDYTENEVRELTLLMQGLWHVLKRQQAERELRAANEQLAASDEELRGQFEDLATSERQLRESEGRFRQLADATLEGIVIHKAGRIVDLNDSACSLFGYSREEMIGKDLLTLAAPDSVDDIRRKIAERYDEAYEAKGLRKDGSVFRAELRSQDFSRGGEMLRITTLWDITARKDAEDAVRESRQRLRTFMDSATDAFTIWDKDLNLIDLNNVALSYLSPGTRKEDVIGKNYEELMPGARRREDYERYLGIIRTGVPYAGSEELPGTGYGKHWLAIKAFRVGEGLGIVTSDITREKVAEEELRAAYEQITASEEELRSNLEEVVQAQKERERSQQELRAAYEQVTAADEELRSQYEELASAQQKLRESEQQLVEITATVPGVVYQFYARADGGMGVYFVSSRANEILGIEGDRESFFDKFTGNVDPRDEDRFLDSVRTSIVNGAPWDFEGRYRKPDGERIWFQGIARPVKKGSEIIYNGILLDITARKRAEEERRISEEKYRHVIEHSPYGMHFYELVPGRGLIFTGANPAADRILKVTHDRLIGKTIEEAFPGLKGTDVPDAYRKVAESGSLWQTEQVVYDEGEIRGAYAVTAFRIAPGSVVASFVDITERKRAENELLLLKVSVDQAYDEVFWMDFTGRILYANNAACRVTGYSREELLAMKIFELDPDFPPEVWDRSVADLRESKKQFITTRHRCRDGRIIDVEIAATYVNRDGREYSFAFVRDITGRKRMEDALFSSQQMLQGILDSIPQRVFWKDRNSVFLGCNRQNALDAGFSEPAEMVGKTDSDYTTPEIAERYRADDRSVMETGKGRINYEEPQVRQDGSLAWLRTSKIPLRNREGAIIGVLGTYEDITDEKLAQEKLRESEERYRSLVESSFDGIAIHQDGILVFVNSTAARLLGYEDPSSLIGKPALDIVHPDERARVAARMAESPEKPLELAHERFLRADGGSIRTDVATTPCTWQGRPAVYVTFRDITERVTAEEALRQKTDELDRYFTASLDLFCIADTAGYFRRLNPEWEKTLGYPLTELEGKRFLDFVHPDDLPGTLEAVSRLTDQKEVLDFTNRYRHKDGSYRWIEWRSFPSGDRIFAAARDITGRKTMEEALRESEERYRSLFENSYAVMLLIDPETGAIIDANPAACAYYGWSHDEFLKRRIDEINTLSPEQIHAEMTAARTRNRSQFLFRHRRADGSERDVEVYSGPVRVKGRLLLYSIVIDVTDRRRMEEELRESEERLRLFIRHAPAALAMFDTDMRYLAASRRWMADYHLGDRDVIGHSHYEVFPEIPAELKAVHRRALAGEVVSADEEKFEREDGSVQWLAWEVRPWYTIGNTIGGIIIFSEDITWRKQAEAALRESEEKYRNLVENSLSIIYTMLPDGTFTFVSPSWKKFLGHEISEVVGKNFRAFVHPDDIPMCEGFLELIVESGGVRTSTGDYRIYHKDGSVHWNRSSVMPVFDAAGNLSLLVGNAIDVTTRKRAEDALLESRAELASILHGSPVLQFVIDRDHHIVSWNKALEEYTGLSAADVVGTDQQWRPFYPEKRPVLADLLIDNRTGDLTELYGGSLKPSPYVEGAYEATGFFPLVGESGSWLSFTAAPVRNAEGTIIGAVETLEDITERVDAEAALRETGEKYRRILENMQDGYFQVDENGIITMVNPSAVRMYGYAAAEEMIGLPAHALYARPEAREEMLRNLRDATPGGLTDFNADGLRKDGTTFGISLSVQFNRDEEGGIRGTEAIVRDISERRAMEHALQEANRKLTLLGSITRHDVANKVAVINGYAQAARMQKLTPEIAVYLSKIEAAGADISRQIAFTKTYQELGVNAPTWVSIPDLVERQRAEGVAITCTCHAEVYADPMLEKVFFNLIDNAVRHGEKVTEIAIRCNPGPDGLVVTVADNGAGVPEELKEKIFERGFGKHTGFGLFLAREIMAITGITIRETGTPGQGAKFEMVVPKGLYRGV